MKPGLALLNSLYGTKAKRTVFGNLWGGPHGHPEEGRKEMKAQKAKMKGNKGLAKFFIWNKGKTDRFWQLVGGRNPTGTSKKAGRK